MIPPIAHQGKPQWVGLELQTTAAGRGCGKVGRRHSQACSGFGKIATKLRHAFFI
jgi:hypothetical protein